MQDPTADAAEELTADAAPASLNGTGVAAADRALARLADVSSRPLDEHVEIFDDVQRQLHDGLAALDDEP